MMASGDADGDGGLDYAELTAINPILYESLGRGLHSSTFQLNVSRF